MPNTEQTNTDQNSPEEAPPVSSLIQPELELAIYDPEHPVKQSAFTLTSTGIIIREDLSEPEWRSGLKLFKWAQTSLKLGFAAYLDFGRVNFGKEKVDQALEQLDFDMPVVMQAMDINTVPLEMRHESLTAEHYLILARANDLTKTKKLKWAKIAADQNLSPNQLKASITAGEVVSSSTARQQRHGIISIHGIRQELDIWLRRVNGIDGILKMEKEVQQDILNEIELFVVIHGQIKAGMATKPRKKATKAK